jgi:hypothetical protein
MALVPRAFLLGGRIHREHHKIHFLLELVSSITPLSGRVLKKKKKSSRHHHLSIVESIFVLLYITVRREGENFLFIKPFLGESASAVALFTAPRIHTERTGQCDFG